MFLKVELDFHEIVSVDASKYVVVHLLFFSKSDHKTLSYGHFNIWNKNSGSIPPPHLAMRELSF